MSVITILLDLTNGYKTHSAAVLMIVTGVGAIASKHYSEGLTEILQALSTISAGAAVVSLRHAVAKVPTGVLDAARLMDATPR